MDLSTEKKQGGSHEWGIRSRRPSTKEIVSDTWSHVNHTLLEAAGSTTEVMEREVSGPCVAGRCMKNRYITSSWACEPPLHEGSNLQLPFSSP